MGDLTALLITILVILFTGVLFLAGQTWAWILPVAWLVFYVYNENRITREWPK